MQQWVRFSAKVAAGFLSAWFLLLPGAANALGLGNIKMDSALNEPLKAEIPLLSANEDDVRGLQVKLGSHQAFLRAGVDRTALLSKIHFNVVNRNGKYYVMLTTQESVREPFLNFLVELNWKNGRMLREYTVLLDPVRHGQQQQVVQAPQTTPPATPVAAPEPMPAPTSPFMGETKSAAPAPAPVPTPTEQAKAENQPQPLFPAVPLNQAPQESAKQANTPTPAPKPAPAPTAAVPKPEPAPMPVPQKAEVPAAAPQQPFETAQSKDNGGLFPGIPLTSYSESQQAAVPTPAGTAAPRPEQAVSEIDYGITKKGDNLWSIAEKVKPDNQVSIYQVMMALQKSNPKAFVDGNIHRLKVGQVMRIADPSLLTAMSKAQALKQYQLQTQDWQSYLASTGHNVPRQAIVAGEQPKAPSSTGVPSGELTLSTPQSKKMAAGTGSSEGEATGNSDAAILERQARKAMQQAKAVRKKNAELSARLNDLEAQLKHMENLVNVKDSDLAALQHKLDELNKERAQLESQPTTLAKTEAKPEVPVKPEASTSPASMPAQASKPEQPAAQQQPVPAETATAKPEQPEKPEVTASTPAPTVKPAQPAIPPQPPVVAPKSPVTPTPVTAPAKAGGILAKIKGFFGGIMGGLNVMMLIIGGVVILLILLLIFIMVRRRKGPNFQESILTGNSGDEPDSMAMDASPSQGSSMMGGESSFLSDFAISGVSAIQTEDSEVDPLTEADVFMAYGRYEAAEERLQEAISQDPQRGELRVKLLELYNTTKDKQGFESAAEDFYAALGGDVGSNPLWQKVLAMGRELASDNPLFSGGVATNVKAEAPAPAAAPEMNEKQDVMDIGLDTGVFNTSDFTTPDFGTDAHIEPAASAPDAEPAETTSNTENNLDFNLDLDQPSATTDIKDEDTGLDFSLDMESSQPAAEQDLDFNLDTGGDELADAGLDFNLDAQEEPAAETEAPQVDNDLDFNLDLSSDEEPTATDIKLGMEDEEPSMADIDFDIGQGAASESAGVDAAGTDMNLDASDASMSLDDSGGGDEVGTKLDLARAYIDMGDPDGARSILDEVMEEGSDGQKQEAQQLMTQIG